MVQTLSLASPKPQNSGDRAETAHRQNITVLSARSVVDIAGDNFELLDVKDNPMQDLVCSHQFATSNSSADSDTQAIFPGLASNFPPVQGGSIIPYAPGAK